MEEIRSGDEKGGQRPTIHGGKLSAAPTHMRESSAKNRVPRSIPRISLMVPSEKKGETEHEHEYIR